MTEDDDLDEEDRDDSRMFRDALVNGDEKFNRFVKLTDARFGSAARRTNKRAKELRDEMRSLRADLAPVIELAHAYAFVARYAPYVGTAIGFALTAAFALIQAGVLKL